MTKPMVHLHCIGLLYRGLATRPSAEEDLWGGGTCPAKVVEFGGGFQEEEGTALAETTAAVIAAATERGRGFPPRRTILYTVAS